MAHKKVEEHCHSCFSCLLFQQLLKSPSVSKVAPKPHGLLLFKSRLKALGCMERLFESWPGYWNADNGPHIKAQSHWTKGERMRPFNQYFVHLTYPGWYIIQNNLDWTRWPCGHILWINAQCNPTMHSQRLHYGSVMISELGIDLKEMWLSNIPGWRGVDQVATSHAKSYPFFV